MANSPATFSEEDLDQRFDFHPPANDQVGEMHESARSILKAAAFDILEIIPEGREAALVLTNLEQAMFWANAAIARHSNPPAESAAS